MVCAMNMLNTPLDGAYAVESRADMNIVTRVAEMSISQTAFPESQMATGVLRDFTATSRPSEYIMAYLIVEPMAAETDAKAVCERS